MRVLSPPVAQADLPALGASEPQSAQKRKVKTVYRWDLIAALFALGALTVVAAFVTHKRGWLGGLGPDALLQFGGAFGLVGVLLVLQNSLVRTVTENLSPRVTVNTYVRLAGEREWRLSQDARPGDRVEFLIRFENVSSETLKDVTVGNNTPKYAAYVRGTTRLKNGLNPKGIRITSDNIVGGGIRVGNYATRSVGYVTFTAQLDPLTAYPKIGTTYDLRNVGIARPAGDNEVYNTAQVLIHT